MRTDTAVIIRTCCRNTLLRAVESVFQQDYQGTIHLLIGVDKEIFGKFDDLLKEMKKLPLSSRFYVTYLNLAYSTSVRHGGIYSNQYGGGLLTALTFLASSQYVAYLDDDDWWEPSHLRLLRDVIEGKHWAFSLSNYADAKGKILGLDGLESVGPGKGLYKDSHGGFCRPSTLMLDKLKLAHIQHLWSSSPYKNGGGGKIG